MKFILGILFAVTSFSISAHPLNASHYHENGKIVLADRIEPKTSISYERDRQERRIKVVTTRECVKTRVNRRNNHLICQQEQVTQRRFFDDRRGHDFNRHDYDRHGYHR